MTPNEIADALRPVVDYISKAGSGTIHHESPAYNAIVAALRSVQQTAIVDATTCAECTPKGLSLSASEVRAIGRDTAYTMCNPDLGIYEPTPDECYACGKYILMTAWLAWLS